MANPFAHTKLSNLPFPEARGPMQRLRFPKLEDPGQLHTVDLVAAAPARPPNS